MRFPVPTLRRSHHDALCFQVILQCFGTVFAAEAAVLDAAERHFVVTDMQRVYPYIAGFDLLRGTPGLPQILRPDRGTEAVIRAVRFGNAFVEILHFEYGKQWSEGFFP